MAKALARPGQAPTRGRRRAWVERLAGALAVAIIFFGAALAGLLLHMRLGPGRRLAASAITTVLSRVFSGRMVIDRIDRLDIDGVGGVTATVYDEAGRRVLSVYGLRARTSPGQLIRVLVGGGENAEATGAHARSLVISRVRIERAEAVLVPDPTGALGLARAFTPRPTAPRPSAAGSDDVEVWLPDVEIGTAEVLGSSEAVKNAAVDLAHVHGSVLASARRTSIRVERYSIRARGLLPAPVEGTAQTMLEMPSSTGQKLSVWSTLDGYLGEVQIAVRGGLDGDGFDLTLDVPNARKDQVRAVLPFSPLEADLALHLEARGKLPDLVVTGNAKLGAGDLSIAGQWSTDKGMRALLDVDMHALDLRSFAISAPTTSLTGRAHVDMAGSSEGGAQGSADLSLEPFRIDAVHVPALSAKVTFDPSGLQGHAVSSGDALSSRVDFRLKASSVGAPVAIDWEWTAGTPEIGRVPWLQAFGGGQAQWHATGHISDGRLDARIQGEVLRWQRSGIELERAHISGLVRGPFAGLALSSTVHGEGLHIANLYLPELEATLEGPLTRLTIAASARGDDNLDIAARTVLERGNRLSGAEISGRRGDVMVLLRASSVEVLGNGVALRDLTLEGAGTPLRGSLFLGPDEWRAEFASTEIDLGRLAKIVRPDQDIRGLLAFDLDATWGARIQRAHARVQLRDGTFAGVSGIQVNGEGLLDAGKFSGGANVELGALGTVTATFPAAVLAGAPWFAGSWTGATGTLQVRAQADLAKLADLPLSVLSPLANAGGTMWLRAILSREELDAHPVQAPSAAARPPPDLDLLVWTDGLRVGPNDVGASLGSPVMGQLIEGTDGQVGVHIEGETGKANLSARAVDSSGIFAALSALADVPWKEAWTRPAEVKAMLDRVPFTAHLSLSRRSLGTYPKFLRTGVMSGEIEATADWTGSLRAPALSARMRAYDAQPTTAALALPVDLLADATYDGAELRGRVQALRRGGVVLEGNVEVKAPVSALLDGHSRGGGRWWEAKGAARILSFPLAGIPALAEREVTGLASGTLAFSGLGGEPEASVELNLANVKINRAAFARGLVSGRLSHGGLLVSGKLDQAQGGGGSASASARLKWSSPLSPVLDRGTPLDFFAEARDLRAAVLYPVLFRDIFAYFDARLNGTFHLREEEQGERTVHTVESSIELREAIFQIPQIGQEFQNGRATVAVDENGRIEVRDVAADAVTGRFTASGSAKLDGFRFARGEGTLAVAKNEAIPVTLEGVSLGEAWGTLAFKASLEGDHTVKLDIDVPAFHTDMPESSSRDLQSIADNPKIEVGMRGEDGTLVPLWLGAPQEKRSEDALRWHLTFYLGRDVYFRRGATMELALGGEPVVDLTDKAHVSGNLDFRSGKVEVFGKRFELEHGTARFDTDEPGNPDVSVTARWDAPDGTRIYADFVGPLRTGVLTLRSEPMRPQSEILSILLLGSSDASEPAPGSAPLKDDGLQTAGAVLAGGAVTTSLNRVLSSVTPLDITTRVAADAQGATPEVAVQIAPGVTAQISYRTRAPSPGEKPDRVFVMLDWRFRRNWSVVTTFGDQQSSVLDLIWQYRY